MLVRAEAAFNSGLRLLPRSALVRSRRQLKDVRPHAEVGEG